MRVAVVGGGVVGLCVARSLALRGAEVVLLERDRAGSGASVGNAGWVTPGLSAPLPAPAALRAGLRWLLDARSPLRIEPRVDARLALWLLGFCWASRSRQHRAGARALLALNARTLELYDELAAAGVEFEMHAGGLLFLARGARALEQEAASLAALAALGYAGQIELLPPARLREREPAVGPDVVGGLHARDERRVRPETLTAGLARWLRAHGVELREGVAASGLEPAGRGRWAVLGAAGRVEAEAEAVVVSAGIWSAPLLERLGLRLPLLAATGYSVTARGEGLRPRHALDLVEDRVACSPFAEEVRLAGTLEVAVGERRFDRRRLEVVAASAGRYLASWRPLRPSLEWSGPRPFAPDGLPLIGPVPGRPGVYAATGHAMLGVTLAPATGEAVATMVLERRTPGELEPFALDRAFVPWQRRRATSR